MRRASPVTKNMKEPKVIQCPPRACKGSDALSRWSTRRKAGTRGRRQAPGHTDRQRVWKTTDLRKVG
jgi:hypothetical protein